LISLGFTTSPAGAGAPRVAASSKGCFETPKGKRANLPGGASRIGQSDW